MPGSAAELRALEQLREVRGREAAARKATLLRSLARRRLATAAQLLRLHEAACFLRAYPDSGAVLAEAERLLTTFAGRGDLRRHRLELADTGIAGTAIHYRFYAPTARWLARRFPARLAIDWPEFTRRDRLKSLLYLLAPYCESPPPDERKLSLPRWLARLRGEAESDAAFLIRRLAGLSRRAPLGDHLYEDLDLPIRLAPGPEVPSRTTARAPGSAAAIREGRLDRSRPDLRIVARRRPLAIRDVAPREGEALVDLAREAMLTRARDLDVFAQADPASVRMIDWDDGFQLACMGAAPEGRFLLEAVYGFLMLQGGVPIGYVLASALFRSSEIAYNVFETFRGGEAARNYGRVLATVRTLFGSNAFAIDPYQLGHGNHEAIDSGAFWFYRKLGFSPAPQDEARLRLLRVEESRIRRDPSYRSSAATLRKLAAGYVFFHLGRPREDVLGKLPLDRIGMAVTEALAERAGSDVERGLDECAAAAAAALAVRDLRRWSPAERAMFRRFSPLVLALPGLAGWSRDERIALARLIRVKGGRRESDFVALFDAHPRLRRALLRLATLESRTVIPAEHYLVRFS